MKKARNKSAQRATKKRSGQSLLGKGMAQGAAKAIRKYNQRLKNI